MRTEPIKTKLIKTTHSGLALTPPPNLTPKLRPAYLEVLAIGIRGLQPYKMLPIQLPQLKVEVTMLLLLLLLLMMIAETGMTGRFPRGGIRGGPWNGVLARVVIHGVKNHCYEIQPT